MDELVKIVGQKTDCILAYLAKFSNGCNNPIMGRLKEFDYKNMWSTWIHHNDVFATMFGKD